MRLTASFLIVLGLTACARYTDKTSPCFGKDGAPVVSRDAVALLEFSSTSPDPTGDCLFEPLVQE